MNRPTTAWAKTHLPFSLLLLWCFVGISPSHAQLQKGTYNFSPSWSTQHFASGSFPLSRSINVGQGINYERFLSDRWMMGLGVSYRYSDRIIRFDGFETIQQQNHRIGISHQLRYYFRRGKWALFVGLDQQVILERLVYSDADSGGQTSVVNDDSNQRWIYGSLANIGLNYPIQESVFWEARLIGDLIVDGNRQAPPRLRLDNRLRLFFNRAWTTKTEGLRERYLRRGNRIFRGRTNFWMAYENPREHQLFLSGQLESFVTKHWTLLMGLGFSYQSSQEFGSNQEVVRLINTNGLLGLSTFIPIAPQVYLRPIAAVRFFTNNRDDNRLEIPFSLELNLFTDRIRWYHGWRYQINEFQLGEGIGGTEDLSTYLGLDYFVLPKVFLRGNIRYAITRSAGFNGNDSDFFSPNSIKWVYSGLGIHFLL